MNNILILYDSATGNTKKMAEFIAEGINMRGRFLFTSNQANNEYKDIYTLHLTSLQFTHVPSCILTCNM